jgi:pSer/pThr/pTyr-binding forkhead associated (FHA) protein
MASNAGVFLRVVQGTDKGKGWELSRRQVYTIGRSRQCNLRLTDRTVSATHAKLESDEGMWFLSDMSSTHGTKVNRQRILSRKPLFDRDIIQLGKSVMEFREYEQLDPADLAEIDEGIDVS